MKACNKSKYEKGSVAMLLVFSIVGFAAVLAYQVPSFFQMANQLKGQRTQKFYMTQAMTSLGQFMKHSYVMGQVDSTCTSVPHPSRYKPKKINGVDYCVPANGNLCVEIPKGKGRSFQICASKRTQVLSWGRRLNSGQTAEVGKLPDFCDKMGDDKAYDFSTCMGSGSNDFDEDESGVQKIKEVKAGDVKKNEFGQKDSNAGHNFNSINIPSPAVSDLWKSCQNPGDVCLRIAVCPEGKTDCSFEDAQASQVVQFSSI